MDFPDAGRSQLRNLLFSELATVQGADDVLHEMLAQNRGVLWIAEPSDDRIIYCSPHWADIWGRPLSDRPRTLAQHLATVYPPDRPKHDAELHESWSGSRTMEYRILRPDGSLRWIRDSLFALPPVAQSPRFAGISEDVTAEKAAFEEKQRTESLLASATENGHIMMILADEQGIIRFATTSAQPFLGFSREETIGRSPADFVHPEDLPKVLAALGSCVATPRSRAQVEVRLRAKDGTIKVVQLTGTNLLDDKAVHSVVITMTDLTELRARQDELLASERRFRNVLDSLQAFVGLLTPDGTVQMVNRAAMNFLGLNDDSSLVGKPFQDTPYWTEPDSRARLVAAIAEAASGSVSRCDVKHVAPNGEEITVDFTLAPLLSGGRVQYLVPSGVDVTARVKGAEALRQKEQEFLHAQKMEAVGRLAGGVAHDFNNILTAVMGFSEFVLRDMKEDNPSRNDVHEIRKAAERAQALTRQLLAFSRHQVMEPRAFSLCTQMKDMFGMLKRLVGEDVKLSIRCESDGSQILADPGQVEQVVLNLVVNARDAMPNGGTVDISVDRIRRAGENGDGDTPWLRLTVADSGQGMTPEVMQHVFEPFFTTKERGQGTGLGLSTVYGIVKQSGGFIELDSQPGRGTTFTVFFPEFNGKEAPAPCAAAEGQSSSSGETVLLVEDEEVVRSVARRLLERGGFHVIEASNGAEGFEKLRKLGASIALIITDIVMPQASGLDMLRRMRALGLHPAILVTSGYTDETLARHGDIPADARYLNKPFTGEQLLDAVRAALSARAATETTTAAVAS